MTDIQPTRIRMRSWLFAPGDSVKKMAKAAEGDADIVIFDLEDAVVESGKEGARASIAEFLSGKSEDERARLWVRINPLDGPWAADDLAAVIPARPGGIMLPKSRGRHDVEELDRLITPLEDENGIATGSTPVIALVTETAAAMFTSIFGRNSRPPLCRPFAWPLRTRRRSRRWRRLQQTRSITSEKGAELIPPRCA